MSQSVQFLDVFSFTGELMVESVEVTTLPLLIKGILRALEHSGKCSCTTDCVAVKCGGACKFLPRYFYSVTLDIFND